MNELRAVLSGLRGNLRAWDPEAERESRKAARLAEVEWIVASQVADVRLRAARVESLADARARLARHAAAGRSVYVHGDAGVGKSFLAVAAFRLRLELEADAEAAAEDVEDCDTDPCDGFGLGIRYVAADDLVRAMQREIGADGDAAALLDRVADARWLALDDLGNRVKLSAYAADELASLIDRRYRAALPTLITSNLSLPELSALIASAGNAAGWQAARVESRVMGLLRGCGLAEGGGDLWPDAKPAMLRGEDRRKS